jgi:hypothetical protein
VLHFQTHDPISRTAIRYILKPVMPSLQSFAFSNTFNPSTLIPEIQFLKMGNLMYCGKKARGWYILNCAGNHDIMAEFYLKHLG